MDVPAIPIMSDQRRNSLSETIQQFGKRLFGFIRGRVNTNEDAEDILQDVWYQFSKLAQLDELENVSAWLYRVARNKVTDKYRKRSNESIEDYAYRNEEEEPGFKELLFSDDSHNPELELFKDYFWDELMRSLDELPEKQREVFVLNELEEMTLQQIADRTGENLKTIISRKGYAVRYLRTKLHNIYKDLNL